MYPWPSSSTCSAASPCARLSRAPSTTSGSDFHDSVGLPMDGPFSRPTRFTDQDRRGSPRFRDASVSARAVLSDPAGVSGPLASGGDLLVPSKFSTLSASGFPNHEAPSLHLRYGPDVARPTLNSCRYLHEPKARFQVERLVLLAWAGIAPAGSARLGLAHQSNRGCRRPARGCRRARRAREGFPAPGSPSASAGSHTTTAESRLRRWAPARASPPSAPLGLGLLECRGAAVGHRPSGCIAAEPAADDTCLRAAPHPAHSACARCHTARRRRASPHRCPPRRGSVSHAATLPRGCQPSRSDPSARGSVDPAIVWLRPRVDVAIGAL